jgi:pantoate--beta-alanine ligase
MIILKTTQELAAWLMPHRLQQKHIGLVPTMGALHEGHLSLIRASAAENQITVVSIFVNPLQFGPGEDLEKYPRRLEADAQMCAAAGADVVFAPEYREFYTEKHQTYVVNEDVSALYCGFYRPGHFRGVLTVVLKLFMVSLPQKAYFGKKDYQQAWLICKMVQDLSVPVEVVLCKTIREPSGLAMSSRNEYMTPNQRTQAACIRQAMLKVKADFALGERRVAALKQSIRQTLQQAGVDRVQYVEFAAIDSLLPLEGSIATNAVLLIACYMGSTRLIDNLELHTDPHED